VTAPAYQLRALSASQAEEFDPSQVGGCQRRWYLHRVVGLEVPRSGNAQEDGDAGHAHFARYYTTGELPGRARMGKAVRGAIAKGELPPRVPGQLVESRFDGQPSRDATGQRVPLRTESTLWLGGLPWDGYVDLRYLSGEVVTVLDHKFSSDIHAYAKPDDGLLSTIQMPVYALDSLRIWPNARGVRLVHHYVSRRGVESFLRSQVLSVEWIQKRGEEIAGLVSEMLAVSRAMSAEHVPGNRKSCHTWSGCPFQSRCTAFKERPKMNLDKDEEAWLGVFSEANGTPKVSAPVAASCALCGDAPDHPHGECSAFPNKSEDAARHHAELIAADTAVGSPPSADDPFAVFAPEASVPAEQPAAAPTCPDCGTELTAENGSQRDGKWTHVRCPAKHTGASASAGVGPSPDAGVVKCANCPHPHHEGACTGKRGRGSCRCGQTEKVASNDPDLMQKAARGTVQLVENVTQALVSSQVAEFLKHPPSAEFIARIELPPNYGHLPTCVQADSGKWLCMDGCPAPVAGEAAVEIPTGARPTRALGTPENFASPGEDLGAALARERGMHRRTLGELDASERELKRLREGQRPEGAPIPMLLWCPSCHARHVDTGDFAHNPHHTHACQACGLAWRPALVPTVGVQFLPGFKDT
jgi:hypothetical protein